MALLAAALLAGCGGGDDAPEQDRATTPRATTPKAKPLGQSLGGSVAAQVNCRDWRGGPRDRKLATVADIRNQVSRTDTGIETPPLSDQEALALFDRACKASYAGGFRLYVLYARAAGFAPLLRQVEPPR